jgi:hypothetical protein
MKSPYEMYKWAIENIHGISFGYLDIEDYDKHKVLLEGRMKGAKTIPKTQSHHAFVPISRTKLKIKVVSESSQEKCYNLQ